MSYRRVARSYRKGLARQYMEEHPRARIGAVAGLMVAVLGVVVGMLYPSHSGTALNTANVASACLSSSPATSSTVGTTTTSPAATATPSVAATSTAIPASTASTGTTTGAGTTAVPATTTGTGTTSTAAPTASTGTTAAPTAATTVAPTATTTAAPTATATASTTATASATPCPTASTTAPVAAANVNCNIVVPANPLSATGLSTPWQLTGTGGMTPQASGCTMANFANLGAFVQATILNPRTGALSVYEPLVITQGTTPAAAPVVPTLPRGAIVTVDVGFNGTDLTMVGATANALQQGRCIDGLNGSIFGQVSFCNGVNFFQTASRDAARGLVKIPALGTSPKTGTACLSTRSFGVVDQDPSDNVTTKYLVTASGQTAQFNAANQGALAGATTAVNGSDNALVDFFMDPTIGCTPFEAPDLSQAGTMSTSQALDELQATKQAAPAAYVPENDEMVLVNNAESVAKTNLYRSEIGQPPVDAATNTSSSPQAFCQNMVNLQTPFLSANQTLLATDTSPVPAVGNNLLTFLANRLNMSFTNLNCQNFGLQNPVTVTLDGNGVATAATFNTGQQNATGGAGTKTPMPGSGQRIGRGRHHRIMDPSGM